MMFSYGHQMNAWIWWLLIGLGIFVYCTTLTAGTFFVLRSRGVIGPVAAPAPASGTPEEVLARRFAGGQIDEPEYAARLAVLHRLNPAIRI